MTNPAMGLPDLASLLATIHGIYPQARVTSGYRGPNDPLTQRNPRSMHAMGSPDDPRAVDVAPIPGVNFNQYVSSIKQAGVPVAQAFDEASHPFPWTTGPNWHIGTGAAPVAAPRKKPSLASLSVPNAEAPVGLDAQPMQAPSSLAQLTTPQVAAPKPGLFGKDGMGWKILGVLGDSYLGANGKEGGYIPTLHHNQDLAFERSKFDAELQQRREDALAKAAEPPEAMQTALWFNNQDAPTQAKIAAAMDVYNPKTTIGPQGEQIVPRVQSQILNGKVYHKIGGQWVEEVQ